MRLDGCATFYSGYRVVAPPAPERQKRTPFRCVGRFATPTFRAVIVGFEPAIHAVTVRLHLPLQFG
jgi:hypothetical protein